jgi:uncharacterized protein
LLKSILIAFFHQYQIQKMGSTFLSAEWKNLIMANYAIDPKILIPYLPAKTELDIWEDKCFVSLIGFMFLNTKVLGVKIPFHVNFEEVNLRFYVRYKENNEWKRGAVFIKEIVPKAAITLVANNLYGEHYETLPMAHTCEQRQDGLFVEYKWKKAKEWYSLAIKVGPKPIETAQDSEEAFITEHYWGYTKINDKKTSEYGVEHPKWKVYKALEHSIKVDFGVNYGEDFAFLNHVAPNSVFMAQGSEISVKGGRKI